MKARVERNQKRLEAIDFCIDIFISTRKTEIENKI
jgi:hypothetical protein